MRLLWLSGLALAISAAAASAQEPAAGAAAVAHTTALPRDLSAWSMFWSADSVVKAVMVGLAIASVVTWTVALAKAIELLMVKRRILPALARLGEADSLSEAQSALDARGPAASMVRAVLNEASLPGGSSLDGIKERAASRIERVEAAAGRTLARGTGILATIGATAPFVGLFGTVWGIMNSFIGISKAQTTNLAVVAPGIAEALLATAIGLVAAIPAVVLYNMLARYTSGCRALIADAGAAVLRLLSRDLERAGVSEEPRLRRAAE